MEEKDTNEVTNSTTTPSSTGNVDAEQNVDELDNEIAQLQKEMDILLGEEEVKPEPTEAKPPKKGDLSKAVAEKNKIIHELREKLRAFNEAADKGKEVKEEVKKEEVKKEEVNPEEVNKRISEINAKCDELEKKYKDSPIPFNKVDVLLDVYKKTGGTVNDLDLLEDVYLASLRKHEAEGSEVAEARKEAQTETPSGQIGGAAFEPKNLEEAFKLIKKK
jgi:chromosome segregation ATPase